MGTASAVLGMDPLDLSASRQREQPQGCVFGASIQGVRRFRYQDLANLIFNQYDLGIGVSLGSEPLIYQNAWYSMPAKRTTNRHGLQFIPVLSSNIHAQ